jgi:hypothetical protein
MLIWTNTRRATGTAGGLQFDFGHFYLRKPRT